MSKRRLPAAIGCTGCPLLQHRTETLPCCVSQITSCGPQAALRLDKVSTRDAAMQQQQDLQQMPAVRCTAVATSQQSVQPSVSAATQEHFS